MSSRLKRILFSQFIFWVIAAAFIKYFLFSFNMDVFKAEAPDQTLVQKLFRAVKIPKIKLGIDLQGGAHLVVSVDVDKAIDNRLVSESKMIEQLFEEKKLQAFPERKEVKDQLLKMTFDTEDQASAAYRMVRKEMPHLEVKRRGTVVDVNLPAQEAQRIRVQSVEQATSILKRRLDTAGVQGLVVQQHGERQIVIQLPGEEDVDEKKELISKTAHLEFKIIEKEGATRESLLDEYDGELPGDKVIVPGKEGGVKRFYLVSVFPDLTGDHITFAKEDFDEYGRLIVRFRLDSSGTKNFADLTTNNIGKSLGIVIDGVMYSSPRIQGAIPRGEGIISGTYTSESARALAIVLNSGSLQAPIKFEYETRVGASLGWDSIKKGVVSCLVGLALLLLFALLYYRLAGLFAFFALLFNLLLVLFFLSWFKFALTLPGIAGMVLTIGMAIDASILIYERIREELANGVPLRKAVQDGFSGATVVILDSNITTFLTGLVLFKFGGPSIRGFAVTLMAGIVATIIASVFFLRSLFLFMLDTFNLKRFGI
ncbi:protein translocase subunit SecD [Candidatus Dependentiae bacterium]|nr:protein translocase subunit SecD [Candidatus Dependentiae bacterium]